MNWEPLASELISAISAEIQYHHGVCKKQVCCIKG